MLKFLRKYQKWMLVIFCAGLMVAFTAQPVLELFMPNPATVKMATTFGENEITREVLAKAGDDVRMLRRLGVEPFVGITLLPNTGSDNDDGLVWLMMQHGADHNGLGASQQDSFQLVASALGAEDMDGLEEKAEELGANAAYLLNIGSQYLKAEQYRQLIAGIEYTAPDSDENATGSPGLRRIYATSEALTSINESAAQLEQIGLPLQQARNFAAQQVLGEEGLLDRISGHLRVTKDELRYTLQQENAEIDFSVVVLDTEKMLATTTVSDEDVQALFERYKAEDPGTGEPYGLGYREQPKVKLEALRIPIDQVQEKVAGDITPEDIRNFFDDYSSQLTQQDQLEEGVVAPVRLTAELRDEVREILMMQRADEMVLQLAQQARQRLNEDARGLEDEGRFKVLPEGFTPTPLVQVAAEIEQEHGIVPEVIVVDRWTSAEDIRESREFTQAWLSETPTSTVRMLNAQFGVLSPQEIRQAVLGGKAGLFTSLALELSNPAQGQFAWLSRYIQIAKPFIDPDSPDAQIGLQVGLPARVLVDQTRSTYVFRLTDAQPSRPATDLALIREQVEEDAKKVNAYEALVGIKDAKLKAAAEQSIASLMQGVDAKSTLTGVQRRSIGQPQGVQITGVTNVQPIIRQAFAAADELNLAGGFDAADEADRLFAVELAGDYKLAIVRLDTYRPMTLAAFQEAAQGGTALLDASAFSSTPDIEPALSMEALMRYTGFEWAEGFGEDNLDDEDGASDEDEAESDTDDA